MISFPVIDGERTLWGAVDEDFNIKTTRTEPGIDADISIISADDIWMEAGDDIDLKADGTVRITSDNAAAGPQWQFGTDGNITFPDNTISTGKGITIPVDQSLTVNLSASGPGPEGLNNTFKINPESIKLPNGNGVIFAGDETAANEWDLDSSNKRLSFPDAGDGVYPKILYSDPINDDIGMELLTLAKSIKITAASNKSWTFGTDGDLTLPTSNSGVGIIQSPAGIWLDANGMLLQFSSNGSVDFPSVNGTTSLIRSTTSTTINSNGKEWYFGQDGKLTAPGNLQVDGGKIILNSAGNAYVESVDYGVNSANSAVNIFGGPYQKIKLRAGFGTEATWTFDTDGDLTAPRNIILNNPVTTVTETETGTIADSNANPFTFRILKSANPQLVIPFADPNFVLKWTAGDAGSLAAAAQAPGGHGVSSLVSDDGTYWNFNSWYGLGGNRPNTGTVFTVEYGVVDSDTTISTTETNLIIEADAKQWTFGTDGDLTLPAGGDIVDSTGATAFVSLATLKQVVAMSTDFDEFRTRIAGM